LAAGQEALIKFYKKEEERNSIPIFIEKSFAFTFKKNRITGRFDCIEKDQNGVAITDFKTSEIKKQKDADKRARESLQLSLYALAYQNIFGELPRRLKLYFLESGLIGTSEINQEDLIKTEEIIENVSGGIRQRNFSATPTYLACTYCAYNQICPDANPK